jgi:hypothetical protein
MINPTFDMLNQRGTPMFFSDVFANRPTAAIVGRIFVSTDTYELYRDTGTAWDLLSGPGSGTITGSGTAFKYPVFTASSVIGNGSIEQLSTKNQSTRDFEIKTSTDDGLSESELILTNRFSGVDDTITFQYGRTILAGSPFLKIQDNSLTFPTSKLTYTGGNFTITDSLLVVTNTLQNNVADFIASAPELTISATGVGQRATLILAPSIGAFAGTIRTGSALNTLEFQTGIPSVTRLTIGETGITTISNLAGTGTRMIVASSTGVLSAQATPTIFGTLATGQVAFGSAADTISGSNNLFWDNANVRLGIGTNVPLTDIHISKAGSRTLRITNSTNSTDVELGIASALGTVGTNTANAFAIVTSNTERMRIAPSTGNVHIGTFVSDSGEKLQVTGTAKVTGAATFSSSVQAGGGTISAGAILQANSTTKGFLPPRMTSTERNAIGTLVAGLMVYDTTLNKLYVYTNAWEQITSI